MTETPENPVEPLPASPQPPQEPMPPTRSGPWGFWATIGLSLVIAVAYTLAQTLLLLVAVVAALIRSENLDVEEFAMSLTTNGLFWSVAVIVAAPVTLGLTVLFAWLARGITVREYLALRWPGGRVLAGWCLALLVFVLCADLLTYHVEGRLVPAFLEDVYRTAYFPPFLWFAFIIVAPVTEEAFFRGFLFKGVEHSPLGPWGAIVVSSVAWALMHTQYDLLGVSIIFLGGLFLGYARWQSRSVYVPTAMHMVQNTIATFEVALSLFLAPTAG